MNTMLLFVPLILLAFVVLLGSMSASESILIPLGVLAAITIPATGVYSYYHNANIPLCIYGIICAIIFVLLSIASCRLSKSLACLPVLAVILSAIVVVAIRVADAEAYKTLLLGSCFCCLALNLVTIIGILTFHHEP